MVCSIIIYAVLAIFGFSAAMFTLSPINIVFSLVNIVPLFALYFATESYCVRMWNFVQQCVYLGLLVLALIVFIASVDNIIHLVCSDADVVGQIQK